MKSSSVRSPAYSATALEFLSRSGHVSDLVGEKLHTALLWEALAQGGGSTDFFWLCLPNQQDDGTGSYILITDQEKGYDLQAIEGTLKKSHHYALAIKLRQLLPLRIVHSGRARTVYYQTLAQRGIKLGDIKDTLLVRDLKIAREILLNLGLILADEVS